MNPIEIRIGNRNFNSVSSGVATAEIDVWNTPVRDVRPQALALQDGSISTFSKLNPKIINIRGWINRANRDEFEELLDDIKRETYGRDQTIEVKFAPEDKFRTWTGTLLEAKFDRLHLPNHCDYILKFWCGNPLATGDTEDTTAGTHNASNGGTASHPFYVNSKDGTGTASFLPVFNLTFNTWTVDPIQHHWLELSNSSIGPDEAIRLTFSSTDAKYIPLRTGDTFEVDFFKRTVKKGNVSQPVSGTWPEWSPTESAMFMNLRANTNTTWNISITGKITHRYV